MHGFPELDTVLRRMVMSATARVSMLPYRATRLSA